MSVRQSKAHKEILTLSVLDILNVTTDAKEQIAIEFGGKYARTVLLTQATACGVLAWLSGVVDDGQTGNLHFNDVILDGSRPKSKRIDKHVERLRDLMALLNSCTDINIEPGSFGCHFTVEDADEENVLHRLSVQGYGVHIDFYEDAAYLYVQRPIRQPFLSSKTRPVEEEV